MESRGLRRVSVQPRKRECKVMEQLTRLEDDGLLRGQSTQQIHLMFLSRRVY